MFLLKNKQNWEVDTHCLSRVMYTYSKTCVKQPPSKRPKLVFKTNYRLMQVKSIAECSKGSILQYFQPSLSYHLSVRSLFCLFLSGRFTLVLLSLIKSFFFKLDIYWGRAVAQWMGWLVRASPVSLRCGSWARHIYPSLVLVQPRRTSPFITERLLMGRKETNQTNNKTWHLLYSLILLLFQIKRCLQYVSMWCLCYFRLRLKYLLLWLRQMR